MALEKLIIEDIVDGTGPGVAAGDRITVHCTGKFEDGTVFDSSVERGEAIDFTCGGGQAPFRLRLSSTMMRSLPASTDLRVLADPKAAETSAAFVWFGYRFGGRSGFQSPRIGALAPKRASNSPDSHTGRPMIAE